VGPGILEHHWQDFQQDFPMGHVRALLLQAAAAVHKNDSLFSNDQSN